VETDRIRTNTNSDIHFSVFLPFSSLPRRAVGLVFEVGAGVVAVHGSGSVLLRPAWFSTCHFFHVQIALFTCIVILRSVSSRLADGNSICASSL